MIEIGNRFDKWVVTAGPFYKASGKAKRWLCKCDCGRESLVGDYDLQSYKSKGCRSCGSTKSWSNSDTSRYRRYPQIPQEVYDKICGAVDNAISRCTKPKHKRYADWGGRGIKVMFQTREEFVDYLLSLPGYDNMSLVLDREDNDGHYEVGNLQFVTRSKSQSNRRTAKSGHRYYMEQGFARSFKRLHDKGLSFLGIGKLYCENQSTIRNCVRELETGHAFGS